MSTNKKALFFDIDGTILSEITGKIPESASAALQKAHDLGHLLFINTGRTICCLPPMICQLPFSGYLCGCGSYIVYNDEVLTSTQIPKERQAEIIRQVKAANAGLLLEGKEDCYRSSHITRFAKLEGTCRYLATLGLTREHYIESGLCDFDKFVIYTDEQTDTDTLFPALSKDMDLIDRLGGIYEVVPKGYSKGTAIDFILKHFDWDWMMLMSSVTAVMTLPCLLMVNTPWLWDITTLCSIRIRSMSQILWKMTD